MNRKTITILFLAMGIFMMIQSIVANPFLSVAYIMSAIFVYGMAYIESNLAESNYRIQNDRFLGAKAGVALCSVGFALKVGGAIALYTAANV
jgi:hypothetical protein